MYYTIDIGVVYTTSQDNDDAIEVASRAAISQSVNRGELRVTERMTIDADVAEATFVKNYARNVAYNNPSTIRKLDIHDISTDPPMLAVEVTTATDGYAKNYLRNWDEYLDNQKNYTNKRHIVIYEAKSTTIPPEGGVN